MRVFIGAACFLVTLLVVTLLVNGYSNKVTFLGPNPTPVNNEETDVVRSARDLFKSKYGAISEASRAALLQDGPCLANEIKPGWVADIAHQPRTQADDDPKNQCEAYLKGTAKHFVELDEQGNYLRAY